MAKRLNRQPPATGKHFSAPDNPTGSTQHRHPLFSLQYLSTSPPYSLAHCQRVEKAAFADTLDKLSQLPWAEINQAPRHGSGYEKIKRSAIKEPIPSHVTEDVTIIAFRFFGKAPMVGYRKLEVFHILWLDRLFTLYDHT